MFIFFPHKKFLKKFLKPISLEHLLAFPIQYTGFFFGQNTLGFVFFVGKRDMQMGLNWSMTTTSLGMAMDRVWVGYTHTEPD